VFRPVRTRKSFEEAVEQIADAVRAGDLRQGERLPSERALAAALEISRPTLREALKVLADAGVVETRGGGTFVRSEVVPGDLVTARSELRIGEVAQVLEARRLLEPRVAQLAALYATEADFAELERLIERQREAAGDRDRVRVLDTRFHLAIARATRNEIVVEQMRLLLRHVEIARDMALRTPLEPELIVATHERTLAAIASGEADEIEAAMDEHLGYLERIWEEESGRPRLRRPPAFLVGRGR
jgi:GntR family transcriptional repressor for pyruvate dehydrogenase complex